MALEQAVEHLADGRAVDLRLGVAAGRGAQLRGDLDRDHQAVTRPRRARLERLDRRLDRRRLERAANRIERLEALAGDDEHDALVGVDLAALGELGEHRRRHAAGGLGEDAGRPASSLMPSRISSSLTASIASAGAAREVQRVGAVRRVADRQGLGDRVGLDRPAHVLAVGEGGATGEQPSAWAPFMRGSGPRADRASIHSWKPRAIFVNSEPEATGATTLSGAPSRAARRSRRPASWSPRRSTGAC